jgi:hypothetical protein
MLSERDNVENKKGFLVFLDHMHVCPIWNSRSHLPDMICLHLLSTQISVELMDRYVYHLLYTS